ncbi:tRNA 2-thiouridine(34) synthase MnmA [Desulfobacca acetoxidans]|uniref:tRNA-specific 2-thiouridylase MnmA n=1 Tax=Desulfobacca acetoxidans (strain ATCC 700848 / DSM 11109 / ASRB2) TaxID=880072 RepID=F2NIA8_DESAR|nr:tRNA 2-thiouridine(34) synthase MnmA [Desulfobacca acetoxidans]AEB09877.1 tRNA-specific 2-thiouridylase mnmA [Desulfobacca acetoxidans DSM 11109]
MRANRNRVAVALSGGLDSTVAAALLLNQGFEVQGVHLTLTEKSADISGIESLCQFLGIAYFQLDLRREFKARIIADFAAQYRLGLTPNPCVRCNELIKFGFLFQAVRSQGFDYLATGHYARVEAAPNGMMGLWQGVDPDKEQSYFLHRLSPDCLPAVLLPLGRLTKSQVREKSLAWGLAQYLPNRESQELCFIPDGDYIDFMRNMDVTGLDRPGPIVNRRGEVLGTHRGVEHYTVGQRQGLGLPGPAPSYVLEIIPAGNRLVVGCKADLLADELLVEDINWFIPVPLEPLRARVKIRYRHPGATAIILPLDRRRVRVRFDLPQTAITPGQAAVFYQDNRLLGGGWIVREQS